MFRKLHFYQLAANCRWYRTSLILLQVKIYDIYLFMKFDTMVLGSNPDTLTSEVRKNTQHNK